MMTDQSESDVFSFDVSLVMKSCIEEGAIHTNTRVVRKWWRGAISPPTHVICATYFFPFFNILTTNPINNWSISPPTLANAPPTLKVWARRDG